MLIAEDDAVSRTIFESKVAQMDHEFRSAADGAEAWRIFQEDDIDVVISDLSMSDTDGRTRSDLPGHAEHGSGMRGGKGHQALLESRRAHRVL